MLELELENAAVMLEDLKLKSEDSGLFGLLSLSMNLEADVLDFFEETLKHFYFDKDAATDLSGKMPLRDPRAVYPHHRDEEMTGATMKIAYGVGGPMIFPDVALDDFALSPKDGERVIVACRAKVRLADELQAGRLAFMLKRGITVSIEPMERPKLPLERAA